MEKLTLGDEATQSADVVGENLDALRALYPEAWVEGKLDFETLKQLLGGVVDEREEKYGLNWHGKRRARQLALTPSTGTLRPAPDDSVDWDTTQNLMIEGDNLEVLKLLQKSYAGKVKLIYIDPPYNTGKDFVYPDDFRDNIRNYLELTGQVEGGKKITSNPESSGRFHTDWLNMMYPRLKLAIALLRKDGILAVSTDDTEAAAIRYVLNELLGEENFLAAVAWEKRYTRSNNAKRFYSLKDTVTLYRRSQDLETLREARTEKSSGLYSNPNGDPRGDWATSSYVNPATKEQRPNLVYTIENPVTKEPVDHPTHAWKYQWTEHQRHIAEDRLWWGGDGTSKYPRLKIFLSEMKEGVVPIDLWDYESTGTTDEGGQEIKELFDGSAVFDNPKPTKLISRLLGLIPPTDDSALILDFFAGSGTTAHAVCLNNELNGASRRYILVQLPEPLLADDSDQRIAHDFCASMGVATSIAELTKERLRRAAKKIRDENPLFAGDLGFRVFKLDSSNIRAWEPRRDDLEQTLLESEEHIKFGRTEQDVVYELLLKLGLELTVPIETRTIAGKSVHSVGGGVLLVCLAEQVATDDVEPLALGIVAWHEEQKPAGEVNLVFRDSAFVDDVAKSNLTAILEQHGLGRVRSV